MQKVNPKLATVVCLVTVLYVAAYGFLRSAGELLRFHNENFPAGNGIRAPKAEWQNMSTRMAADSGSVIFQTVEFWRANKGGVLETVFWPLRELESGLRKHSTR